MVWAGGDTGAAVAAAVLYRGVVAVGRGGGDELANVAVGAKDGIDKEGVAPYPAKTGAVGPLLVADGDSVDTGLGFKVGVPLTDGSNELEKHPFDALVVVFAIGILRYAGSRDTVLHGLGGLVAREEHDDTSRSGD